MKNVKMIAIVMGLFAVLNVSAQDSEVEAIKSVISKFSAAGDANDSEKLATYLDDNYRIVMNQLFGSEVVTVMTKSIYIEKIASKEFGGDKRKVSFGTVFVNGNTANAIVTLRGEKMTTKSIMTLVKNSDGIWNLVSDMPVFL